MKLKIGIIGGSLAGCSAAILLSRAGHSVEVFERSEGKLIGRGGGIGTSGDVFNDLVAKDVIDEDMPHLHASTFPFLIRTPEHEKLGYSPLKVPTDFKAFHWSTLWNTLRKRVPDKNYHTGHEAVNATSNNNSGVTLFFKNGNRADFDLVLYADGYQSFGRKHLFPEHGLQYKGYILWRGLLPESEMETSDPLEDAVSRIWYPGQDGNFVIYLIPGHEGQTATGQRLFNWAAYIPLPEIELDNFMIDSEGKLRQGSIPPGKMRPEEESRLKEITRKNLPSYYGEIVEKTPNTYVQLIYTCTLPSYYSERSGLIGDSGMVIQPFTGSGIFKGYNNAADLVESLRSCNTLEEALNKWSLKQIRIGNHLMAYGSQMEEAYIYSKFDLAAATKESAAAWWKKTVTPPKEFSIIK